LIRRPWLSIGLALAVVVAFGAIWLGLQQDDPDHAVAQLVQDRDGVCYFDYETSPLQKLIGYLRRETADSTQLVSTIDLRVGLIEPGDATVYARCRKLQGIDLSYTRCDDSFLDALGSHSLLRNVELEGTAVTDEGVIRLLRCCPQISKLDLSDTHISDKLLHELAARGNIRELHLAGNAVTDHGIVPLCRACPTITQLGLCMTGITDASLASIGTLPNVDLLLLAGTEITDAGLAHLAARRISTIDLAGTEITSAGIAHLRPDEIEDLDLEATDVDDTVIDHVLKMPELKYLTLAHCRLTDAGARRLAQLKQLQSLDLTGATISEAVRDELQQTLPRGLVNRGTETPIGQDPHEPSWHQRLRERILERCAHLP
jgi:Leucine-rich repeat (LRR) protein